MEREQFDAEWEGLPYRPMFGCPVCKGAGFIHPLKQSTLTPDYRNIRPCPQPGCYGENYTGAARAHQPAITQAQTFLTFDAKVAGVGKAYRAAQKIAEGDCDYIWLLIYGGVGNGKTHLLNAIRNTLLDRGKYVRMYSMADLLSELRIAIQDHSIDAQMKQLKEASYLLIDELGLEYGSDWEKEKIDELFGSRWANGKHTIAATNSDVDDLPERLRSRFKDKLLSRWIRNEAVDYRLRRGH